MQCFSHQVRGDIVYDPKEGGQNFPTTAKVDSWPIILVLKDHLINTHSILLIEDLDGLAQFEQA